MLCEQIRFSIQLHLFMSYAVLFPPHVMEKVLPLLGVAATLPLPFMRRNSASYVKYEIYSHGTCSTINMVTGLLFMYSDVHKLFVPMYILPSKMIRTHSNGAL